MPNNYTWIVYTIANYWFSYYILITAKYTLLSMSDNTDEVTRSLTLTHTQKCLKVECKSHIYDKIHSTAHNEVYGLQLLCIAIYRAMVQIVNLKIIQIVSLTMHLKQVI